MWRGGVTCSGPHSSEGHARCKCRQWAVEPMCLTPALSTYSHCPWALLSSSLPHVEGNFEELGLMRGYSM